MLDSTRLICGTCASWTTVYGGAPETCVDCGGPLRKPGPMDRIIGNLLAAPTGQLSAAYHRHVQLIQEMWILGGRDQELYAALRPRMSLSKFTSQVTEVVIRGLDEGWIEARIPRAPFDDDAVYELKFLDSDRFIDELARLFAPRPKR